MATARELRSPPACSCDRKRGRGREGERTGDVDESSEPKLSRVDQRSLQFKQKESDQQITAQVEGSLTTFTQTGLAAGQEYSVTLTGEIDGRRGTETSTEFMTLISGPTNLRVVKTTTTSAVVQWEKSQGEIDRYHLTITPSDGAGRSEEMTVPPDQDSAHIQRLEAGRTYDIILVAEKGSSRSEPATTKAVPGPAWRPQHYDVCFLSHIVNDPIYTESFDLSQVAGKSIPRVTMASLTRHVTPAPGLDQEFNPSPKVQNQQGRREDERETGSVKPGVDGPNRDSASVIARTKPLVNRKMAINGTRPKLAERPALSGKPKFPGPSVSTQPELCPEEERLVMAL
ncbi:hypothetical protein INR49_014669 [Caranx melampygus]|nr:hypothetical protein INR49_014669 [Caranx melampygus]